MNIVCKPAKLPEGFFEDWLIEGVCSHHMDQLADAEVGLLGFRFLEGAVAVAREVAATGTNWAHIGPVYGRVGREVGFAPAIVQEVLASAWRWANCKFHHWSDLSRSFVFDWTTGGFLHLDSGELLDLGQFNAVFQALSPDPEWLIGQFLIEQGLIVMREICDVQSVCGCSSECIGNS